MKKQFLILFLFLSLGCSAQIHFGIRAGAGFMDQQFSGSSYTPKTSAILCFHAGLQASKEITKVWSAEMGLLFQQKGADVMENPSSQAVTNYRFNYVELPFNIVCTINREGLKITPLAGLYLAAAVGGTYKNENGEITDIPFAEIGSTSQSSYNRTDFGVQFGGGLEWRRFFLRLQYSLGLRDAYTDPVVVLRNRGFGASLGYWIK